MKIGGYEINVPFVTTSSDHVKIVLELAQIQPGQKVVDLGSGDGRVVLAFANTGASVEGYEFKPELVKKSRQRIENENLQEQAKIFEMSFWDISLAPYDVVYIYGMQSIMDRLELKLEKELRPGSVFISNIFKLPRWKPKKSNDGVLLYVR
jgi:2-polyprenyl-3-methyl-5-hydroxy-6-metoxy-1,4-benzoquinol methylase